MRTFLLATLLSAAVVGPPVVIAAPPGVQRWLTLGSTGATGPCGSSDDLFSIGFVGQVGTGCLSLADGAATDFYIEYFLFSGCELILYSAAGCSDTMFVEDFPSPPPGTSTGGCVIVEPGFRSLEVDCELDD